MRHARADDLDRLEPLLDQLRDAGGMQEKTRGVFYRKSRAFLHFHADPIGLFADLRAGEDFVRLDVTTTAGQALLMAEVKRALAV